MNPAHLPCATGPMQGVERLSIVSKVLFDSRLIELRRENEALKLEQKRTIDAVKLQQQRGHLAVTWNLGTNAVIDFFYFWCCVELTQLCQLLNFDIAVEVSRDV